MDSTDFLEITPYGSNDTKKYYSTSIPETTTYDQDQWVLIYFEIYGNSLYDSFDIYKFSARFTMKPTVTVPTTTTTTTDPNNMTSTIT